MSSYSADLIALADAAAHAAVLRQQLALAVNAITTRYPNNKLGGLVQRLQELVIFAEGQSQALQAGADAAMRKTPEFAQLDPAGLITATPEILRIFEQAQVLTQFISVAEAAQAAKGGRLVVLRDRAVQQNHLVPKGAVIFEAQVDRQVVRAWWPRIFSRELNVAILPTDTDGVWLETTYASEDLPQQAQGGGEAA